MSQSVLSPNEAQAELERREAQRVLAKRDPLYLMSQMAAIDKRTGDRFDFSHLGTPLQEGETTLEGVTLRGTDDTWRWQRFLAEKALTESRLIVLKGRQIGVTWVLLAADVAEAITMPGTDSLLYRQKESEAIKNAKRWWVLYQSLPQHFKEGIRVLSPDRGVEPGRDGIRLQFPDGAISSIVPMSSAGSSGHGESVRRVILDEAAYIEALEDIGAAVAPAAGGAKINIVSTGHGISDEETGEGNEFHRRWVEARADRTGYYAVFFPFDVHADRYLDEERGDWRDHSPEAQELKPHRRREQYPATEHEAFALSQRVFFDEDDLVYYGEHVRQPLYRMDFRDGDKLAVGGQARIRKDGNGFIRVYVEPKDGHQYAIGCDPSTGRGRDSSAAYVVNLSSGELCAEFHGRLDADLLAAQLHFLGKWYHTAWLAVERNGIGEAVIVTLRHGREGRPAYPKLYRHVMSSRPSQDVAKVYGYPVNVHTRPLILNQLEKWVRDRALPYVTERLLFEMQTFVERDKDPSPAAQDGSHDDAVMAAAITLELFRLYGRHPARDKRLRRKRQRKDRKTMFPWQHAA